MLKRFRAWVSPHANHSLQVLLDEYSVRAEIPPTPSRLRDYTQPDREAVKERLREALAARYPRREWSIALLDSYLAIVPDQGFDAKELYYVLYWDVESLADAIQVMKV